MIYRRLTTLKWRIQVLLFYFSHIFAVLLIPLQEHDTWELLQFARSILLTSFTLALRHSNNASLCLFVWLFVCFFSITRFFNKDAQVWQVHEGILLSLTERDPLVSNASISDKMHILSGGILDKFSDGEAPPRSTTPYPSIYHFSRKRWLTIHPDVYNLYLQITGPK